MNSFAVLRFSWFLDFFLRQPTLRTGSCGAPGAGSEWELFGSAGDGHD